MTGSDDPAGGQWHLDKRVPIAMIVTIALQTVGFGYWAGRTQTAIDTLQDQVRILNTTTERLARVETRVDNANETLARIETRLERRDEGR